MRHASPNGAWHHRLRLCGRIAAGLSAFFLSSVLSLKPAAPVRVEPVGAHSTVSWTQVQQGLASFYARTLHGRVTASGVRFDNKALVAAHPRFPFGTIVRVTNLANGQSVKVRIVDRGPARGARAEGVIIDLSRAAAEALDLIEDGRARVRLEVSPAQAAHYVRSRASKGSGSSSLNR